MMSIDQDINRARTLFDSQSALFAIHYASESFYEAQDAPMAVSAIAVFDVRAARPLVFGRADTDADALEQEKNLLSKFYDYLNANKDAAFIHWNMAAVEFGFDPIAKRYEFLFGEEPPLVSPREVYNVDKMIRARYGEDYAPHRRFESISTLNNLDTRGFLDGKAEAEAFKKQKWGDIGRSTGVKSKLIAKLFDLLAHGALRTNSSAGMLEFAGERIDAAQVVLEIGERFSTMQRALRDRHGGRPAVTFVDEYDDQYLMGAALRLFFDDVRPEDYTPSYAGSSSRVDYLLPEYGLAVELKHTRASMTDKDLGAQLLVDRDRYVKAANARHLIAIVFDPTRELSNPRGLERDLQREYGSAALAVTVRIYA